MFRDFVYTPLFAVILAGIVARITAMPTREDLGQLSPVAHPPLLHLGVRTIVKLDAILPVVSPLVRVPVQHWRPLELSRHRLSHRIVARTLIRPVAGEKDGLGETKFASPSRAVTFSQISKCLCERRMTLTEGLGNLGEDVAEAAVGPHAHRTSVTIDSLHGRF